VGKVKEETVQVQDLQDLQLLRAEDVARILKVTPSAVFKWSKKGIIPSYRIHEKCLRFKREDIAAFIEKGKGVGLAYKKDAHR
jgi:predicted site-specific integrase-resolvase